MALGDRLFKKVAASVSGHAHSHAHAHAHEQEREQEQRHALSDDAMIAHADSQAAAAPQPMLRSHKSNVSNGSTGSSASGGDAPSFLIERSHSGNSSHRSDTSSSHGRSMRPRPPSTGGSNHLSVPAAVAPFAHRLDATPQTGNYAIIQKGYLLVKKGMLKGYEKRFYFLTNRTPDLFSFKDDLQFREWLVSGLPLRKHIGSHNHGDKHNGHPTHVCTVLRADRAGDANAIDRAIAVIVGDDNKCSSIKFLTPTADDCEDWIQAFHRVQLTRRHRTGSGGGAELMESTSETPLHSTTNASRTPSVGDTFEAHLHRHDRVGTPQHNHNNVARRLSDASDAVSQQSTPRTNVNGASSAVGVPAAAAPTGNVLLFVPAAGSAISMSDSKLAKAKKELEELVAAGAKPPMRGGMENAKTTNWRYGLPEYILSDLEYMKGKTRDHDSTPLESYAETCCQTFIMEATHKALYREWTSVRQEYFYIQVNDGEKIPGNALKENDLFGLLYLNNHDVGIEVRDGDERRDPRAILSEAFTQGFPMEVVDVYTQPPQCHFSWRHWGRFTGRYKGVRGNGQLVEIRGFGQMHIDGGRLLSMRLFFKQRDLFDQLNKVATAIAKEQGITLATPTTRAARQGTASSATDAGVVLTQATQPQGQAQAHNAQPQRKLSQPPTPNHTQQPESLPHAQSPVPSQSKPQQKASPQSHHEQKPQAQAQPQRQMRSDKLSPDSLIGDFTQFNVVTSSGSRSHSDGQSPPQHTNRTHLYQRFMPQPQAPSA